MELCEAGIPSAPQFEDHPPYKGKLGPAKVLPPSAPRHAPVGDNVVLPNHYARFKIEPIHFIGENQLNFFQGNVIKYILRHDAKNGLEDVRKAIRYASMYHEYLKGNPDWAGEDPETVRIRALFAEMRHLLDRTVFDLDERAAAKKALVLMEESYGKPA